MYPRRIRYWFLGPLLAAVTAALLYATGRFLDPGTISCVFLLAVTIAAVFFGRTSALLSAVCSALLLNYFFIEPRFTLSIAKRQDVFTFLTFLISALVVGQLSSIARQHALTAERQREELRTSNLSLAAALRQAEETEDLRRSEQVKSALLDAVTHDLRTPLTSIKASATTLLSSPDLSSEARSELLAVVDEECDRLNQFIESMLRLARLQSGSALQSTGSCAASEIVEAALHRLPRDQRHPITVEQSESGMVNGDPALLSEVLFILLDNAVKHTPSNTPVNVTVKTDAECTVFEVRDFGPGIPAAARPHIFERFYRAPGRQQGLGMGLAIAKNITEAHGGSLVLMPADRGALFRLTLPVRSSA